MAAQHKLLFVFRLIGGWLLWPILLIYCLPAFPSKLEEIPPRFYWIGCTERGPALLELRHDGSAPLLGAEHGPYRCPCEEIGPLQAEARRGSLILRMTLARILPSVQSLTVEQDDLGGALRTSTYRCEAGQVRPLWASEWALLPFPAFGALALAAGWGSWLILLLIVRRLSSTTASSTSSVR